MSQHAKSVVAAFGAVVFVAITAWQQATAGGFRRVDLIPLAVVVVGAVQTHVIPNVPELPWAKSVAAGSAAVLSALATLVASDPSGVTAGKLLTVAASAFLVWFVPEFGGPELAPVVDGAHVVTDAAPRPAQAPADLGKIGRDLIALAQEHAPDLPVTISQHAPTASAPAIPDDLDVAQALKRLDEIDAGTALASAAAPVDAPTPTYDAVAADLAGQQAAAQATAAPAPLAAEPPTAPMAAVAAGTPAPTTPAASQGA